MTKPPKHLGTTGAALWRDLHESYEWSDPGELSILDVLCTAADRITEARELIAREGICVPAPRGGTKVHPAHTVEKDNSNRLIAAWKALRLDADAAPAVQKFLGRPPGVNRAN